MEEQTYILTMLVANKPGVTSRITGLFSGRGYNMESVCGAPTHDPEISRITVKTKATPDKLTDITNQLNRLIDVVKLRDMTLEEKAIKREMALISVDSAQKDTPGFRSVLEKAHAKIVNVADDSVIIEITGVEENINQLIENLQPYTVYKVSRSGVLALYRELER